MLVAYGKGFVPDVPMRQKTAALERAALNFEPVECPIRHHFAPGVYLREMTMPEGVTVTGAIHKHEHLSILSKGRVLVTSDDGVVELAAPATLLASVGTKRALHALEESVWTTVHATNTRDLDALVEELTESKAEELQGGSKNPQKLAHEARLKLEG
jgi:hypothetical protein